MKWARVKDGVVESTIKMEDDERLKKIFSEGYDYFINVSDMDPWPCPGWLYDGKEFSPPPQE